MLVDGDIEVLTAAEPVALPDAALRRAFIAICNEFVGDWGLLTGPVDDMPWLRERDAFASLTTAEMRRIVVEQQYWFYPKEANLPGQALLPVPHRLGQSASGEGQRG